VAGSCEHDNKPSGSIKEQQGFLGQMSDYKFIKDSATRSDSGTNNPR
jgi:hypothetical protein